VTKPQPKAQDREIQKGASSGKDAPAIFKRSADAEPPKYEEAPVQSDITFGARPQFKKATGAGKKQQEGLVEVNQSAYDIQQQKMLAKMEKDMEEKQAAM
jgi:hypothetical protein